MSSASYVSMHGRDLWSGDYVLSDETGQILLVSPDARQVRTIGRFLSPTISTVPGIVQSHVDGDLRVLYSNFVAGGMVRVDPRTGARVTLRTQPYHGAAVFETTLGSGTIVVFDLGSIQTISPSGTVLSTTPFAAPGPPWGLCRADGRRLSAQRRAVPNRWDLRVHSVQDAGRAYIIALSATGFTPGIAVGARTIPLVPDGLFTLSLTGGLGPMFQRGSGVLPASGVANATLDVSRFGSVLSGLRIWAAAAIIDPTAPMGFTRLTKPEVIVLD